MNPVAAHLAANHERLGLDRLGIPRRPQCVVLTPRFRRSRHIVVLVLSADGSGARLVGKLPRLAGDGEALAREAANLRAVAPVLSGGAEGTAPALVDHRDDPAYPLLVTTALSGTPLSPAAVRRDRDGAVAAVTGWLDRLATATAAAPPDDAWYERVVQRPLAELAARPDRSEDERELARRTLREADALRDAGVPLVFEHGDLGHPNLLRLPGGRVGVLDWERGDPHGLPLADLVFFLAYAAATARGDAAARLRSVRDAFAGPRAWARRVVERHAAGLGIDRTLVPTLVAVCCARVVLDRQAPEPAATTDAAPRLLEVWREVVRAPAPDPAIPAHA